MISLVFSEPLMWKREFFKMLLSFIFFLSQSVFGVIEMSFGGLFEMKSCKSAPVSFPMSIFHSIGNISSTLEQIFIKFSIWKIC